MEYMAAVPLKIQGKINIIRNTYNVILYGAILLAYCYASSQCQGGPGIDISLRSHQLETSRRALGYYLITRTVIFGHFSIQLQL